MKEHIQGPGPTVSGNSLTDLKAIRERAEKATEGQWRSSGNFGHRSLGIKAWELVADFGNSFLPLGRVIHQENLDFIAHAREDIPMLLKALAEAEVKLGAFVAMAEKVRDAGPSKDDQWWVDAILGGSE